MQEPFILEVEHNGKQYELDTQYQPLGYIHRFIVVIEGVEMWFERDEEGSYRAVLPHGTPEKEASKLDRHLLAAVAARIEEILS